MLTRIIWLAVLRKKNRSRRRNPPFLKFNILMRLCVPAKNSVLVDLIEFEPTPR